MCRSVNDIASESPVPENGFNPPVTEEIEEYFVCRQCRRRIARAGDHLAVNDGDQVKFGIFRDVFNVEREHTADPGFDNSFIPGVFCSECGSWLGVIIVRVAPHYQQELLAAGNYIMMMSELCIESGNLLLNAITREVDSHIHN